MTTVEQILNSLNYKKIFLTTAAALGAILLCVMIYVGVILSSGLPSLEQLENPKPDLATKVLSAEGEILDHFFVKRRTTIHPDSIPTPFINALIATEDREFQSHWGIHLSRVFKAVVKYIISFGRKKEGASTITQQLARNLYLTMDQNLPRKIREAYTAIQIEKTYTKKEILWLYTNTVYFGRGAYGLQVAADVYFGKPASELTTSECAYLVALLKSPEGYDAGKHYERAVVRRNVVLDCMRDVGALSNEEYEGSKDDPIVLAEPEKTVQKRSIAPHFVEMVRQQLSKDSTLKNYDLYRDGLVIHTTLSARMQEFANEAVDEHLKEFQEQFNRSWKWENSKTLAADILNKAIKRQPEYISAKTDDARDVIMKKLQKDKQFIDSVRKSVTTIQLGFVAVENESGAIRAMVGGTQFGRKAQYMLNHAVQIRRQPGSSFKPFVYASALKNGLTPESEIESGAFSYTLPDGQVWSLAAKENQSGKISLYQALKFSVNTVAARLMTEHTTPREVVDLARKMGVQSPLNAVPALALGAGEVTPLEMTAAFSVFPNQGLYYEPFAITKIEDQHGNVLFERKKSTTVTEALSSGISSQMVSMMRGVVNGGTASRIRKWFPYEAAAGKTGTTNDFADAWFVGFTPELSAGVWVGFDDMRVKFTGWYGQGGTAAAPVWGRFMGKVYRDPILEYKTSKRFADTNSIEGDYFRPDDVSAPPMEDSVPPRHTPVAPPDGAMLEPESAAKRMLSEKKRELPSLRPPTTQANSTEKPKRELPRLR